MFDSFKDAWDYAVGYVVDNYFTPSRLVYDNFDLNNALMPFTLVIISIFIGVNLASLSAIYNKRLLGSFIRSLISGKCSSPADARSLADLGYERNFFVRAALRPGGILYKYVSIVKSAAEENVSRESLPADAGAAKKPEAVSQSQSFFSWLLHYKQERVRYDGYLFYIPEDKIIKADLRFDSKGTNFRNFFIMLILSIIAVIFLIYIIPQLLTMLDDFITEVRPAAYNSAPANPVIDY